MAFGDGNNDIEMFQAVDMGVAMENASDDLKAKNVLGEPERIVPHVRPLNMDGNHLQLEIAPQSFNVYRIR